MVRLKAGDVVVIPFPFSDLSQAKVRPALCLANAGGGDWVFCQITSQPYDDGNAVLIDAAHFHSGRLNVVSYVRPAKLFTASHTVMHGTVGLLKSSVVKQILRRVTELFETA